jgi:hypothetical protein
LRQLCDCAPFGSYVQIRRLLDPGIYIVSPSAPFLPSSLFHPLRRPAWTCSSSRGACLPGCSAGSQTCHISLEADRTQYHVLDPLCLYRDPAKPGVASPRSCDPVPRRRRRRRRRNIASCAPRPSCPPVSNRSGR